MKKLPGLANWPRYPGGAIAGGLVAVAGILIFLIDSPALRHYLRAAGAILLVLWMFSLLRSDD